jgi:hypothetical protein
MKISTLLACVSLWLMHTSAIAQDSVFLEELTWTEVRDLIDSGTTRVLIPTAGTEQNGPHMVLGKHRYIIEHTADLIARELGQTLVAPIMTHVPEGDIDPPSSHMKFPGTISLPNEYFVKVLEYTARSLAAHGFTDILFISDSGSNMRGIAEVTAAMASPSGWKQKGRRLTPLVRTRASRILRSCCTSIQNIFARTSWLTMGDLRTVGSGVIQLAHPGVSGGKESN